MRTIIENPTTTAEISNGALTFEQIKDIVGNGWAVIKDPVFNGCIFLKGELYYHSHDKERAAEVWGKSKEKDLYLKFCGKRDPNTVYLL